MCAPRNWVAYILFGVGFCIAVAFWLFRDTLYLCTRLFKESSVAIVDNWTIIPSTAGIFGCGVLVNLYMLAGAAILALRGKVTPPPGGMGNVCFMQEQWYYPYLYSMASFTTAWFMLWLKATQTYIVGDAIGCWCVWPCTQGSPTMPMSACAPVAWRENAGVNFSGQASGND